MPFDLSRSVLTILVPGFVAVAPWLLAIVQHTSATLGLATYPTLGNAVVFAVVVVAGSVCEGLGSHLEGWWDERSETEFDVKENWFRYLASNHDPEPVGNRYISRMLTTMYFELAMLVAALSFVPGCFVLVVLRWPHLGQPLCWAFLPSFGLALRYFWWQARCSHIALCRTRMELNGRMAAQAGTNASSAVPRV